MAAWSSDEAKAFVEALFTHVWREDAPPAEWIENWTERAVQLGSAERTFQEFVDSPGYRKRLDEDRDARSRWPNGHFYSPVTSRRELERDAHRLFAHKPLPGLELRDEAQLEMLGSLAAFFGGIPFPETLTPPFRYHYRNSSYGFGDALIYWAMLNFLRPARILEVGSGYSSALALDTIDRLNLETHCTFLDPYPALVQRTLGQLPPPHRIIESRVQDMDLALLDELEAGDLLFIDSTHVLKTGSDVHFELTQLLPRLKPGVLIHFHDLFTGFEYPRGWAIERNYGWNEAYALHLFLQYNQEFTIEFFNHHVATTHTAAVRALGMPQAERFLQNPGGGLWLSRR